MLPEEFKKRMQQLLREEYPAFAEALACPPQKGIYVNRIKLTADQLLKMSDFTLRPSPYSKDAFLIEETVRPGLDPLFAAGAYYVQEPSAMCAAEALGVQSGDRVLDLCAAPGGKACRLAGLVGEHGVLVANEIVHSRAKILASNLERMGARAVVTSASPEQICAAFPSFFDRILVDAPCSGEGMFRKDSGAIADWSEEHVIACAHRQYKILETADRALRPGGRLVYSTCTFAPEENEEVVCQFAKRFGYQLEEITAFPHSPGFVLEDGMSEADRCARIFPHRQEGEGHFVALLRKHSQELENPHARCGGKKKKLVVQRRNGLMPSKERLEQLEKMKESCLRTQEGLSGLQPVLLGDYIYLCPDQVVERLVDLEGLIWPGIQIGRCERGRIEPCHHLFKAVEMSHLLHVYSPSEEMARRFLRGEGISCEASGYTAVSYRGLVLGFGKAVGGQLKNRYPKGLRLPIK